MIGKMQRSESLLFGSCGGGGAAASQSGFQRYIENRYCILIYQTGLSKGGWGVMASLELFQKNLIWYTGASLNNLQCWHQGFVPLCFAKCAVQIFLEPTAKVRQAKRAFVTELLLEKLRPIDDAEQGLQRTQNSEPVV